MTYSVFGGTLNPTLLLLSSLPVILVFWGPNFFREFQWEHPQPTGALNARGWEKVAISDQYLAIARKRSKMSMLRCIWPPLNPLSIYVTLTAIVPELTQGRPKCAKNVLKWRTFELTGWITGKRLKIDGYMLWCVWQALNHLFIHVTFTAIVPGAYHSIRIYSYAVGVPMGGQNVP